MSLNQELLATSAAATDLRPVYQIKRMFRVMNFTVLGLLLSAGFGISLAHAQGIELVNNLPIEAVTVYPRTAIVTRSGNVSIPSGSSTLVIENLPMGLDAARLQLSISNTAVQFSNLQIQENFQTQNVNERENEVRNQLQTLHDNRQVIVDRIDTAQSELRLLNSLAEGGDSGVRATLTSGDLDALIDVLSDNSAQARERIRDTNIELRDLDRQIEQQQFELNQIATNQTVYSRLLVRLQADTAVSADVALSYPQTDASWSWLYEARLDTERRNLGLFRQAAVMQGTGENWNNIALTLSTANPTLNSRTPELAPVFVDVARPRAMSSRAAGDVQEVVVTGSVLRGSTSLSFENAAVADTRYQVDYIIPGSVNVPADRQQQVLPVDNRDIAVELVTRAVPAVDIKAYLEARFDFDENSPIQAARMQLYRDGAFIGDTRSPELLPGQSVGIPFGVDSRIQVQRFDEQQESGTTGIFNRSDVREERVRYEITSRHPATVNFELLDRVPVSLNADISVTIPREATAPTETDFGGESGILMWQVDLAPQQTATVRHYFDIRHPDDMPIEVRQ